MQIDKYTEARFWSRVKVSKPDSCWYWDNPTHEFGYGWFKVGSKNRLAHRIALIIWQGEEKPKLHVLHNCDNPACCNPNHLRWGTDQDNHKDAMSRGRHVPPPRNGTKPPVRYGESNNKAVLTAEEVREMRRDRSTGLSLGKLAKKYSVSKANVSQIINFKTWKTI